MGRREFTVALWTFCMQAAVRAAPAESDAAAGVRLALQRGAEAAVGLLGRADGFWGNPFVLTQLLGRAPATFAEFLTLAPFQQGDNNE